MRVILPPPRSLQRAGGGGGNNSDYSQGRDYFNAEIKRSKSELAGLCLYNLPYVDQFLSDKNTPCYSLLEGCFFNGKKNLYYNKPSMFFHRKTYIQIHIQTYLYRCMRINIYSNKFINIYISIHTSSEYVPPPRQRGQRLSFVYTKTHLATSNDHAGNSSPQG